ncbi:MAG TPA: Tex family protein [Bacillales bacterium]|nr:Tex family protein [Bacillales bacterium]
MVQAAIAAKIANERSLTAKQVSAVIQLLEGQNTIPFIARYRKEMTGGLDEVEIRGIEESWRYEVNLTERKQEVLRLIEEQGKLNGALKEKIEKAAKLQEVEDLYRPYKQKRRTRAAVAKERGLEPLAEWLLEHNEGDPEAEAEKYVSEENEVPAVEDALQGARDVIAEQVSDQPEARKWIRSLTERKGVFRASVKEKEKDEKGVYEMYYAYEEPIRGIVPHRVLACNRGEKEGVLRVEIAAPHDEIIDKLTGKWSKKAASPAAPHVQEAVADAYKRLIQPSIEREIRKTLTERAEEQAIHIFSENLKHLLLQPPLKGKVVLGVDPAYRTGCKLAVIDETGKVLDVGVIYPTPPYNKVEEAKAKVLTWIGNYKVEMIAIGNGTASRETEQFIADVLKEADRDVYYLIVNEAGASVYSASELAREEFPKLQVEERSAISIGRRLQDPLSELVKIDPKSVGVGQYQHDVSQKRLNESLSFVVETAVNRVGVNVNTASVSLLQYVAGLSKATAKNIVKKREEIGKFQERSQMKSVPRLGAKTFEQCIGFLRIVDGRQPLDRTGIHPERYPETIKLLEEIGCSTADIGTNPLRDKLASLSMEETAQRLQLGLPTLRDIVDGLSHPGRDPREEMTKPLLKKDVLKLEDLKKGMEMEGTVRNVVDFGAFIDIGVKQDGLVHISKLSNRYVKHPLDVVHVGEVVKVWVEDVNVEKGRVALTMLEPQMQSI